MKSIFLVFALLLSFSNQRTCCMNSTEISVAYAYFAAFTGYMLYHFCIKTEAQKNIEKNIYEQKSNEANIRAGIRFEEMQKKYAKHN